MESGVPRPVLMNDAIAGFPAVLDHLPMTFSKKDTGDPVAAGNLFSVLRNRFLVFRQKILYK